MREYEANAIAEPTSNRSPRQCGASRTVTPGIPSRTTSTVPATATAPPSASRRPRRSPSISGDSATIATRLHDDQQSGIGRGRAHEAPVRERERDAEAEHAHRRNASLIRAGDGREDRSPPSERQQKRRADHTARQGQGCRRNAIEGEAGGDVRRPIDEVGAEQREVSPHRGPDREASRRSRSPATRRRACRAGGRRRPPGTRRARGA